MPAGVGPVQLDIGRLHGGFERDLPELAAEAVAGEEVLPAVADVQDAVGKEGFPFASEGNLERALPGGVPATGSICSNSTSPVGQGRSRASSRWISGRFNNSEARASPVLPSRPTTSGQSRSRRRI